MSPGSIISTSTDNEANGHKITRTAVSSVGKHSGITQLAELDASLLQISLTQAPRAVPRPGCAEVASFKVCSDHMVSCQWTLEAGWSAPQLHPYGPLSIMPTASCLQYATECFEGLKLYRGYDGKLRLFRPELNASRMVLSAARIALPAFAPAELLSLIKRLCGIDGKKWLPEPGTFLYIRPTMIANDPALGVQKPKEALLYVILSCFPRMDLREDGKGMRLLASKEHMVRAWPGGFGFAKVGANYGPTLVCQAEARSRGFSQILWLFGSESDGGGEVTEAGASNFFVVWRCHETGAMQLITSPLTDQIILDGITRRSVLELASKRFAGSLYREDGQSSIEALEVVERRFTMSEIARAADEGRLLEAFVAGTAYFISGVEEIEWKGKSIRLQVGKGGCGTYAGTFKRWLEDIMYGRDEGHPWGHVVEEAMDE